MVRSSLVLVVAACAHPAPTPPIATPTVAAVSKPSRAPIVKLLAKPSTHVAIVGDNAYVDGAGPLMISRDRGRTFAAWSADSGLCVSRVLAAPRGGTIYVVAARCSETDVKTDPDKLYRSSDDGATWQTIATTSVILRGLDPRDPHVVYGDDVCGAVTNTCRSDNGGETWHALAMPVPSPTYAMLSGSLFVADDGTLFYEPPRDNGYELDRSDDRGETWHIALTDPDRGGGGVHVAAVEADGAVLAEDLDHCRILRSRGGHPFQIVLSPAAGCEPGSSIVGHGHFACGVFGDDQVVASNDDGATWKPIALEPAHFAMTAFNADGTETKLEANARFNCYATADRLLVAAADALYDVAPPW